MPTLLLKLKNVPDDEHMEICELLEHHGIEYYETNVGFWGIGMAAIWLRDEAQLVTAHDLLNAYTETRQNNAREAYKQSVIEGDVRTIRSTIRNQPLIFILYCAALLIILGLSILPFLGMM